MNQNPMKRAFQPIKDIIIGGVVFLIPVVIIVAIVGEAIQIMLEVGKPLGALIPVDSVGGIALANLLALLAIILLCFIAGLIARSEFAKKGYRVIDSVLLTIPGYIFIKGFADSIKNSEDAAKALLPVIVRFSDHHSRLGFEVERLAEGDVVVYLPGAPNPWSGSVIYFSKDRVERLDISMAQAIQLIQELGRNSAQYS